MHVFRPPVAQQECQEPQGEAPPGKTATKHHRRGRPSASARWGRRTAAAATARPGGAHRPRSCREGGGAPWCPPPGVRGRSALWITGSFCCCYAVVPRLFRGWFACCILFYVWHGDASPGLTVPCPPFPPTENPVLSRRQGARAPGGRCGPPGAPCQPQTARRRIRLGRRQGDSFRFRT